MRSIGSSSAAPSERIVLPDLVLRRWCVDDAEALAIASDESIAHLRPWFAWAAQERTVEEVREGLESAARRWEAGEGHSYAVMDRTERSVIGAAGLQRLEPTVWEVGFWVHIDHTGRGVATATAAALTDVAFSLPGTERVELHCDKANTASAAVARHLGYRLLRIEHSETDAPAKTGEQMIWAMNKGQRSGTHA